MIQHLLSFDHFIFLFINVQLSNPIFDIFFKTITEARTWIIPAIITAALFIKFEKKQALIVLGLMLLTIGISDPVSSQLLKTFFHRPRPCNPDFLIAGGNFLFGYKGSFSFPSSHAMNMFSLAALLSFFYPKRFLVFYGFASMIGLSRIYVGVHYPSDILGGVIFGIIVACGVYYSYLAIKKRWPVAKIKPQIITKD